MLNAIAFFPSNYMTDGKGVPNIIVAEQDLHVSNLIMGTFKMEGFLPHQVMTAEDCLAKVKELGDKLDAIIIDGRLASDRGTMLIVNIRKMNSKAKIFVLAERFEEEHKTRVLDYGADEFTVKPLSIATLVSKISMLLLQGTPIKA